MSPRLLLSAAIAAMGVVSCASDIGSDEAMIDRCLAFCDLKVQCDAADSLPETYLADCQNACDAEASQNADLGLSRALISCSHTTACADFNACVAQGGSSTDDEYGGFSGE